MRQGQQNRRGRGRNNNSNNPGRKGQNPLTRSFESNGPDVKIRGTPAHVAEKYMAMARDAHSSGDPVLAENYLQHAEHYNRIILAYREQQMQQGGGEFANGGPGGMSRHRPPGNPGDIPGGEAFDDEDSGEFGPDGQPQARGQEPQPRTFDPQQRFEDRPQRQQLDQPHRHYQQQHHRDRDRHGGDRRHFQQGDRPDRGDRFERQDRQGGDRMGADRGAEAGERQSGSEGFQRHRDRDRGPQPHGAPSRGGHEQPEFLRRSVVRRSRQGEGGPEAPEAAPVPATGDDRE